MQEIHEIKTLLVQGDREKLVTLVQNLIDHGYNAEDILYQGLVPGMETVGDKMAKEEIFIPEVLLASMAMRGVLEILKPALNQEKMAEAKTIVIGTVYGDVHDIGKELVTNMLKGAGFNVIDLGVNVPVERFLSKVESEKPDILGMSAMLTTTMQEMEKVIKSLNEAGLREKVKVIVGGAPVNEKWALEIGADAYGEDCLEAVKRVKELTA
jgi:5-methyltetrahydrofolate--homocysteine methyltransferase